MQKEIYTTQEICNMISGSNVPFADILLNQGNSKPFVEGLEKSGYQDGKDIEVKITFNDVEIRVCDLNTMILDWWNRLDESIKDRLDYYTKKRNFESSVEEEIERRLEIYKGDIELLKDKLCFGADLYKED